MNVSHANLKARRERYFGGLSPAVLDHVLVGLPDPVDLGVARNAVQTRLTDKNAYGQPAASLTVEPSGGGAATTEFIAEDLLIPAGTDWLSAVHELGTVDLDPSKLIAYQLYLEVEEGTDLTGSIVGFGILNDTDYNAASASDLVLLPSHADRWYVITRWVDLLNVPLQTAVIFGSDYTWDSNKPPADHPEPPSGTYHVGLITGGPTAEDIRVVKARASFLLG